MGPETQMTRPYRGENLSEPVNGGDGRRREETDLRRKTGTGTTVL